MKHSGRRQPACSARGARLAEAQQPARGVHAPVEEDAVVEADAHGKDVVPRQPRHARLAHVRLLDGAHALHVAEVREHRRLLRARRRRGRVAVLVAEPLERPAVTLRHGQDGEPGRAVVLLHLDARPQQHLRRRRLVPRAPRGRAGAAAVTAGQHRADLAHGHLVAGALLVAVKRHEHLKDGAVGLQRLHHARGEGCAVAHALHVVEDGYGGVAREDEVAVQ